MLGDNCTVTLTRTLTREINALSTAPRHARLERRRFGRYTALDCNLFLPEIYSPTRSEDERSGFSVFIFRSVPRFFSFFCRGDEFSLFSSLVDVSARVPRQAGRLIRVFETAGAGDFDYASKLRDQARFPAG